MIPSATCATVNGFGIFGAFGALGARGARGPFTSNPKVLSPCSAIQFALCSEDMAAGLTVGNLVLPKVWLTVGLTRERLFRGSGPEGVYILENTSLGVPVGERGMN